MKTIEQIRREHLYRFCEEHGGPSALARKIGKSATQISQWLHSTPNTDTGRPRVISSDIARGIESSLQLECGLMDHDVGEAVAPEDGKIAPLHWPFKTFSMAKWLALPEKDRDLAEACLKYAVAKGAEPPND